MSWIGPKLSGLFPHSSYSLYVGCSRNGCPGTWHLWATEPDLAGANSWRQSADPASHLWATGPSLKEELSGYLCATRNTIVFIYSLLFLFLLLVGILGTQGAHAGSVQPITPGFMTGCALSAAFGGLPSCRAPGLLATLLTVPDSILCLPACALPGDLL